MLHCFQFNDDGVFDNQIGVILAYDVFIIIYCYRFLSFNVKPVPFQFYLESKLVNFFKKAITKAIIDSIETVYDL
jgi:hypothetical protein